MKGNDKRLKEEEEEKVNDEKWKEGEREKKKGENKAKVRKM